jgi:DNA replication protein DnaC
MSEPENLPAVSRRLLKFIQEPNPKRDAVIATYEKREAKRREREEALMSGRLEPLRGLPLSRHPGVSPEPWEGGLLHGRAGVGKTRASVARLLSVPLPDGIFVDFIDYLDLAREIELERASDFVRRRWELIFRRKFLVIDDLGARRPTDFAIDSVYRIVDRRWNHQQETLVTSNLSVQEIADRWDERIASRIASFGRVVKMDGPDQRLATF